jgi:type I restriction enzyme, S subunit
MAEQVLTVRKQDLPSGWSVATIEDLVGPDGVFVDGDWVESKDQDPDGEIRLIQLADIGDGEYRNRSDRFLTHEKALELGCTFLKKDDVLIARMPDPLGRACIFPGDRKKSVTVVDVAIVRSGNSEFNHRWLMYFINAPMFRSSVASLQSGSTRKRISRGNLARIALPVPPREQQNRIVAEIEKQFSLLDEAVASLKRTKANLKRYKAAVLKAAVVGKLTEEWRKQHPDVEPASKFLERILKERRQQWDIRQQNPEKARKQYLEPCREEQWAQFPVLPLGWCWTSLESLTDPARPITYGILKPGPFISNGVPMLRIVDIKHGHIDASDVHLVSESLSSQYARTILRGGEVLISLVGTVGTSAYVGKNFSGSNVHRNLGVISIGSNLDGRYLNAYINSEWAQMQIRKRQKGGNQSLYNLEDLKRLVVAVPPMAEQQYVIEEVERRLSVIDELESTFEADLTRADRLRQSILASSFSGRLMEHVR